MVSALRTASEASADHPDAPPPTASHTAVSTGRGRPRVHIDPDELAKLSTGRTTLTDLGKIFQCDARTVRRRLLELGLAVPGAPVYVEQENDDGTTTRTFTPGVASNLSKLSDSELDTLVHKIHSQFPTFGRRMIDGYLLQAGHRIPRSRLLLSLGHVVGPATQRFGSRRIERCEYSVAGPGALWHHDGQHGEFSIMFYARY